MMTQVSEGSVAVSGSTVVRRQLGRWLRQLRREAGKTEVDIEEAGLASRVKLWRIETGQAPVKFADVRAMCWLYGADDRTTDTLANLALATKGYGWWEDYRATPTRYGLCLGLEAVAESIDVYDPDRVHPLLQTPDYMQALYLASNPDAGESATRDHLKLGPERQQVLLTRTPPLRITAVLGEAALGRPVGGTAVMAEQVGALQHLTQLQPHVDIRILPLRIGAHPAMQAGAFNIFGFSEAADPAAVHVETHTGARYFERPIELAEYRRVFGRVYAQAVPINEFRQVRQRA
jgi:hypothetical protein